jgi:hypothetical protein
MCKVQQQKPFRGYINFLIPFAFGLHRAQGNMKNTQGRSSRGIAEELQKKNSKGKLKCFYEKVEPIWVDFARVRVYEPVIEPEKSGSFGGRPISCSFFGEFAPAHLHFLLLEEPRSANAPSSA